MTVRRSGAAAAPPQAPGRGPGECAKRVVNDEAGGEKRTVQEAVRRSVKEQGRRGARRRGVWGSRTEEDWSLMG